MEILAVFMSSPAKWAGTYLSEVDFVLGHAHFALGSIQ